MPMPTAADPIVRVRSLALAGIDRSPRARRAMARIVRSALARRGPLNSISDEAVEGAGGREAKRTAEMLMWSAAVEGHATFPKWFPAAHHVTDPEGRRRSADALRAYLAEHPEASSNLWRQFFALSEPNDLGDVRAFVRRDVDERLRSPATAGSSPRPTIPEHEQLEILVDATQALEAIGCRPFLVSGTLLGLVREGRLLPHDYDIDLGLLPGDGRPAEVDTVLSSRGFDVQHLDGKVVGRRGDSGFAVDVFLHYERDGLLWHGTEIHEWWNTPFELQRTALRDVPVWIPDNAETYLKENYGRWDRPVAFYNFSFDTPNRHYRHTHQALLYLHKRLVTALDIGDRWSVESAARELRDAFDVDVTDALQPTGLLEPSESTTTAEPSKP